MELICQDVESLFSNGVIDLYVLQRSQTPEISGLTTPSSVGAPVVQNAFRGSDVSVLGGPSGRASSDIKFRMTFDSNSKEFVGKIPFSVKFHIRDANTEELLKTFTFSTQNFRGYFEVKKTWGYLFSNLGDGCYDLIVEVNFSNWGGICQRESIQELSAIIYGSSNPVGVCVKRPPVKKLILQ